VFFKPNGFHHDLLTSVRHMQVPTVWKNLCDRYRQTWSFYQIVDVQRELLAMFEVNLRFRVLRFRVQGTGCRAQGFGLVQYLRRAWIG
jgi:hypothetical protein